MGLSLTFSPLVPWLWIFVLGAVAVAVIALGLWRGISGGPLRSLTFLSILAVLANPSILQEEREDLDDVVLVFVDESSSLSIGDRRAQVSAVEAKLNDELAKLDDKEVRVLRFSDSVAQAVDGNGASGTQFKTVLDSALAEAPLSRLGSIIVLTDGQVHDLPSTNTRTGPGVEEIADLGIPDKTPLHVIVVGEPNEVDRVFQVNAAPKFGLVGETVEAKVQINDLGIKAPDATAIVSVLRGGKVVAQAPVGIGKELSLSLPISVAGQNLFELRAETLRPEQGDELSLANNSALISVNGVRERLQVLLVSGQPHQGERAWRNLLKSDPSVDLVHFTILRPAEKRDNTPIFELSLIAFPVRQLFQEKLYDFDLIIFDQYPRRGILPPNYFNNIVNYVSGGGALFVGSGPSFATTQTIYATALSSIIPGRPNGVVYEQKFKPQVSELGQRHPITSNFTPVPTPSEDGEVTQPDPDWGSWMRHINVETDSGQVLMTGVNDRPLLIADRVGDGRVVQLASDNLWLWSRGFEGGGPDKELLRRSAHWLMGEPELEEERLQAKASNGRLHIERRSLGLGDVEVEIETPSGKILTTNLVDQPNGRALGEVEISEQGIYILRDGQIESRVAVGSLNPKELSDLRSTMEVLAPFVTAQTGFIGRGKPLSASLELPDLRPINAGRKSHGADWIGIVDHKASRLLGLKSLSLTPALLALILILGLLIWGWRRESR